MAIPKAYQTQMQADIVQERAENAAGDRAHIATKRVKSKARKRINLRKKRKYFWLGLVYMIFLCFIKWSVIVEKWEANGYKIEFPGISFSVGKKVEASTEKPAQEKLAQDKPVLDKPGVEKAGAEKQAVDKPGAKKPVTEKQAMDMTEAEKTGIEKSASDAIKTPEQKDKSKVPAGNEAPATVGKVASDATNSASAGSAAKTQNVVTLETDGAGFDPLSTSSPKEVELLLKLASRRKDVEKREALIKERELAASVVEKQQKDKIAELTKLKESIEALLKKSDKDSQEQHAKLIKYYEGMKPKRAAQIFDRMDIAVLKELVPAMSQKKALTILDQMSVVKVKELLLVMGSNKNLFAKSAANAPKK